MWEIFCAVLSCAFACVSWYLAIRTHKAEKRMKEAWKAYDELFESEYGE